jgi:DNA polymerase-3 subunit gamma/tau
LAEERQNRETDRKKRLREDALAHPMVKAALEVFSGEVREVKAIDKGFV